MFDKEQCVVSSCCKASILPESDVCSRCYEHCEVMTYCSACDGDGSLEYPNISGHEYKIGCKTCGGTGLISKDKK